MTVSTTTSKAGPFACNGITTAFAFTFPVIDQDYLLVYKVTIATGASTLLARTTDYTVTLITGGSGGGSVNTLTAYSADYQIVIYRSTPRTQSVNVTNHGAWLPTVFNAALDKLTELLQECWTALANCLQLAPSGAYYDAGAVPIRNTVDPVDGNDLARKSYVNTQDAAILAAAMAYAVTYANSVVAAALQSSSGYSVLHGSMAVAAGDSLITLPITFKFGIICYGGAVQGPGKDYTHTAATDTILFVAADLVTPAPLPVSGTLTYILFNEP